MKTKLIVYIVIFFSISVSCKDKPKTMEENFASANKMADDVINNIGKQKNTVNTVKEDNKKNIYDNLKNNGFLSSDGQCEDVSGKIGNMARYFTIGISEKLAIQKNSYRDEITQELKKSKYCGSVSGKLVELKDGPPLPTQCCPLNLDMSSVARENNMCNESTYFAILDNADGIEFIDTIIFIPENRRNEILKQNFNKGDNITLEINWFDMALMWNDGLPGTVCGILKK